MGIVNTSLRRGLAIALFLGASAASGYAQMRFQNMDSNGDGVITRNEWQGNARDFREQDWNHDGVLSGDEVRLNESRSYVRGDWNRDGMVNRQDALIAQRFRGYDRNGDGRITPNEWRAASADPQLFNRLDRSGDRALSLEEYAVGGGMSLDAQGGPSYGFSRLDRNGDGWVMRNEWLGSASEFNRLDTNRDNRVSRFEFERATRNDNGYGSNENRYGSTRSAAYRNGWDRGIAEGRQAGREDYANGHGWDLDGQTELERADSGYNSQMGSLSDYQAGYRAAFREAYRAGFNEH
jgi:Ca2+-binding EF-hand superfamily protein